MKEKIIREIEFLVVMMPTYQQAVRAAQVRMSTDRSAEAFTNYTRAVVEHAARVKLVELLSELLEEDNG